MVLTQGIGQYLLYTFTPSIVLLYVYNQFNMLHMKIRYGQRPSYGSESSNRPGSSYSSADAGGYGYGNGGYGSYGGTRPGHGITATLENGNDFNPDEPDIPDNNVPQYPGTNIQTQKVIITINSMLIMIRKLL